MWWRTAGSISNADGSTLNISATDLSLTAEDQIGAGERYLTTAVDNLTAASTGTDSAGLFISEADSLTLEGISAGGAGDITVTAADSIAVDADLTTAGNITLDAQGGNLVMTGTSTSQCG